MMAHSVYLAIYLCIGIVLPLSARHVPLALFIVSRQIDAQYAQKQPHFSKMADVLRAQ